MTNGTLDQTFAALAHPVRRNILDALAKGPATVNDLAEPFDMSLPAISRHIRVLQDAGLIVRERNAQFRPCRLDPAPLREVTRWTEQYRHIWDMRFNAMDQALEKMKGTEND